MALNCNLFSETLLLTINMAVSSMLKNMKVSMLRIIDVCKFFYSLNNDTLNCILI